MSFSNSSSFDERISEINRLGRRIIEVGYRKGFKAVKNDLDDFFRLAFGDHDKDHRSMVEIFLFNLNLRPGKRLAEQTLKDILQDTAMDFHIKLSQHAVDLARCKGEVLRFIWGIAANKFHAVWRRQMLSRTISIEGTGIDIRVHPESLPELNIWRRYLKTFSAADITLLVLRLLQGLPFESIAGKLHCPSYTCRKRWTRIRDKLKAFALEHDLQVCDNGLFEAIMQVAEERKIKFPCESGMIVTYDEVEEKMSRLHPLYRRLMYFKYFEELSDAELQQQEGLSLAECNRLIEEAKRRLLVVFIRESG